jgi:hypothetical protein
MMELKRKYLFPVFICFLINSVCAQNVAINTSGTAGNASAILDLNTGNTYTAGQGMGLLIPNVALT